MNQQFKIACSIDNLQKIRSFVISFLQSQKIDEQELNLIVVAVDEICANLIIHSNHCDSQQFIELSITSQKNGVMFEILDKGKAFNPESYKEPSVNEVVEQRKKGGMGIMLVRRIMDEIEYTREKNYNVCRMYKKLSAV